MVFEFKNSNNLITLYRYILKIDLITYLVNMGSILSFWFGFSVLNFYFILKDSYKIMKDERKE